MIVNEPYLLGWRDGEMYFEEPHAAGGRYDKLLLDRLESLLQDQENLAGVPLRQADKDQLRAIASVANGVPVRVGLHDMDEVLARASTGSQHRWRWIRMRRRCLKFAK